MPLSDYSEFLLGIDFELITLDTARGPDGRFTVARADGSTPTIVELPDAPIDIINTTLGARSAAVRRLLRPVCEVPRLSTYAVGTVVNEGVRRMHPSKAYVNVGTWHGFSLLAGMAGNRGMRCIGIDNFSKQQGPRAAFRERFERHRAPGHRFFDMDYRDYFATEHREPIGLYFYDGDHAYEHQLEGLRIAEPFFSDDCVIVVDDTNWADPREATLDFIAQSKRQYRILLDVQTPEVWHPTFWNGLTVFQVAGSRVRAEREGTEQARRPAESPRHRPVPPNPVDFDSKATLVSLVVCNHEPDAAALEAAIDAALAQSWPSVEVLVADASADESVGKVIGRFGDRIVAVPRARRAGAGPRDALEASSGSLVSFVDSRAPLERSAVELGLALPGLCQYHLGAVDDARKSRFALFLAAAEAINAAIPRGERFVLVGGRNVIAATIDLDRAMLLWGPQGPADAIDESSAIERLEEFRRAGAAFAVFIPGAFRWLADRPGLRDYLATKGRAVLENEVVRIFELNRA